MSVFASKIRATTFVCAAAAMAIFIAGPAAYGRVGVTSQTDGDPLGKPPTQDERVLRVGIDIQANELITTKADDRAHIVFLDGTALTVAPNANLVIDKFVYDPQSKTGEIAVSVATGVFRLVGGKISKTGSINIKTQSATIGLRGGIGLFVVTPAETKAHFLFGISMAVTANGRTETAIRTGSLIVTKFGSMPTPPTILSAGAVAQVMSLLEAHKSTNRNKTADEEAKKSGFSAQNSERGVYGTEGIGSNGSGDAQQAVSNANAERQTGITPSTGSTGPVVSFFSTGTAAGGGSPTTGPVLGGGGPVSGGGGPTGGPPSGGPPFRATPATGVGNGGLIHAIPGGPPR
jgi:hypothetical protein